MITKRTEMWNLTFNSPTWILSSPTMIVDVFKFNNTPMDIVKLSKDVQEKNEVLKSLSYPFVYYISSFTKSI